MINSLYVHVFWGKSVSGVDFCVCVCVYRWILYPCLSGSVQYPCLLVYLSLLLYGCVHIYVADACLVPFCVLCVGV